MGDIRRPYKYGRGSPYPGAFIQCVDGIEPMIHKLWCHRTDRIYREVHLTARVDIPAGTVGEFFTGYFIENVQHKQIIGELSINGSVQFIRLSEIWGCGFPFIPNTRAPEISCGWGSTGAANSNGNPGSAISTGIWGGSFANSTVNWIGNCSVFINASPDNSQRIPPCPCVDQRRVHDDFFLCSHQKHLWHQYNRDNPRVYRRRQIRYFSDRLATQLFWSIIMLIVCVTVYGSISRSTCVSITVAMLNSYTTPFIVMFLTASTSLSNILSFSLANIVFEFSLCELDMTTHISSDVFSVCYLSLFIFSHESQN